MKVHVGTAYLSRPCIVATGKLYIIVEYCTQGSLLSWLRARRSTASGTGLTTMRELIGMAKQVAVGMEFLVSKNVSY